MTSKPNPEHMPAAPDHAEGRFATLTFERDVAAPGIRAVVDRLAGSATGGDVGRLDLGQDEPVGLALADQERRLDVGPGDVLVEAFGEGSGGEGVDEYVHADRDGRHRRDERRRVEATAGRLVERRAPDRPDVVGDPDVVVPIGVTLHGVHGEEAADRDVGDVVHQPDQVARGGEGGDAADVEVRRVGGRQHAGPQRRPAALGVAPHDGLRRQVDLLDLARGGSPTR